MTRHEELSQAFMLWLAENNANPPDPADIMTLGAVAPSGNPFTPDEVESTAAYLEAVGLIQGPKAWGRSMPLRVSLTPDGLRCVRDVGGDVTAWNDRLRPSYTDQSVNVNAGRDAQVAAHSQYVNQAQNASSVKVDKLLDAASGARDLLPSLATVAGVDTREVEVVVKEIEAEGATAEPDHGKLRRLGTRLKDLLGPGAAALALVRFTVEAITNALS
ncbi:hypothetical protein AB0L41_30150 [Amycolatopsis mediterranei]|uniref:hypothetical protein n=1 Tax=Amycolatopsis mediterranei TaxID=33910 RepID=UPI00344A94A7